MGADERHPVGTRRALDDVHERGVERLDAAERPRLPRRGGDPRGRLEDPAEARREGVAVQAVDGLDVDGIRRDVRRL
jgi:hypothetical protein